MNQFLRFLYNKYPKKFQEFLVEDMYKDIPKDMTEPALSFLANGRETLERFFNIYAYKLQRRAVSDLKKADMYFGMLVMVKALLSAISEAKKVAEPPKKRDEKPVFDPLKNVDEFVTQGKKRILKG